MKTLLLVVMLCATACADSLRVTHERPISGDVFVDSTYSNAAAIWSSDVDTVWFPPRYTPAEKLAALHVWRHVTGYGMEWEHFIWPNKDPIYVWYSCRDTTCEWREVRP